jgi:cytoskeletal protein CcmA (bactofilin family)
VFGHSKGKSKRYAVGDIIEPLLEEERSAGEREMLARITEQQMEGSAAAYSAAPAAPDATSSISSGLSIVGKIVGNGRLAIFGHVTGEVHASTVQIGDGAQVEANIVAEELTIGGRVKGTIHANRVKLNSTAVVEGDIYHRSLAIEENAQFEGMSRRQENVIDMPSLVPAKLPQAQAVSINVHEQGDGAADGVNASQGMSIDHNALPRWIVGGSQRKQDCPLPRRRTFVRVMGMSAMGQKQT